VWMCVCVLMGVLVICVGVFMCGFCNVWVCVCMCGCFGNMCGCVYVWVL